MAMTESDQGERSTDTDGGRFVPEGRPFTTELAKELADRSWEGRREKVLKELGVWHKYKCVPPKKDREKPLEAYLPGGEEYDPDQGEGKTTQ